MIEILHLFLAHLIADFGVQSKDLAEWKGSSVRGMIVHILMHLFISVMILFPYLKSGWTLPIISGVVASHFIIDEIKVHMKGNKKITYFVLDQMAHLAVIMAAGYSISMLEVEMPQNYFFENIYLDPIVSLILCGIIIATYGKKAYKMQRS